MRRKLEGIGVYVQRDRGIKLEVHSVYLGCLVHSHHFSISSNLNISAIVVINRSVLDNFHAAMNAVNDPDIAAVAETLQLAQDAILSDPKQLPAQLVARLYEVKAISEPFAGLQQLTVCSFLHSESFCIHI